MDKKIPLIIAAVSLVAAAGGISFGIKANNEKNAALEKAQALMAQNGTKRQKAAPEELESTPLVALKQVSDLSTNDVAKLQEQLAARDAELERLRAELERRRDDRNPRQSFQERMAQMKEEDPERYAEMIQRRTERAEQMRYDQATRLATFMDMDTRGMSEEELANHNALIEKLTALWDVSGEFDPENPPNWEAMREAVGDFREFGAMMDQERSVMLRQLGTDVGLAGTDADEFSAYVQSIIDTTSMRPPRGMRGGPRGGGN